MNAQIGSIESIFVSAAQAIVTGTDRPNYSVATNILDALYTQPLSHITGVDGERWMAERGFRGEDAQQFYAVQEHVQQLAQDTLSQFDGLSSSFAVAAADGISSDEIRRLIGSAADGVENVALSQDDIRMSMTALEIMGITNPTADEIAGMGVIVQKTQELDAGFSVEAASPETSAVLRPGG